MKTRLAMFMCAASLAIAGRAFAHHSFAAEFDNDKPVLLTGTITKVEWANPHTWFFMDVKNADGSVTNWGFEMPGPTQLLRLGMRRDSMKVGDVMTVDARGSRDGSNRANAKVVTVTNTGKRLFAEAAPAQ